LESLRKAATGAWFKCSNDHVFRSHETDGDIWCDICEAAPVKVEGGDVITLNEHSTVEDQLDTLLIEE